MKGRTVFICSQINMDPRSLEFWVIYMLHSVYYTVTWMIWNSHYGAHKCCLLLRRRLQRPGRTSSVPLNCTCCFIGFKSCLLCESWFGAKHVRGTRLCVGCGAVLSCGSKRRVELPSFLILVDAVKILGEEALRVQASWYWLFNSCSHRKVCYLSSLLPHQFYYS